MQHLPVACKLPSLPTSRSARCSLRHHYAAQRPLKHAVRRCSGGCEITCQLGPFACKAGCLGVKPFKITRDGRGGGNDLNWHPASGHRRMTDGAAPMPRAALGPLGTQWRASRSVLVRRGKTSHRHDHLPPFPAAPRSPWTNPYHTHRSAMMGCAHRFTSLQQVCLRRRRRNCKVAQYDKHMFP